jgi:trehalose/maltose hydrolase-like predicted phosphorylase
MYIARDRRTGWYRQFDGYERLKFIDPLSAEDRYEEAPGAAETQTVKQADVIMLLYLLRGQHPREEILENWDYYVPRTAHGTSLSAGTHAAVAARLGLRKAALRYFRQSVNMDLLNWRGDSGRGLHGAAMGGAVCAVLFGFGGLEFREDCLRVDPILPEGWTRLRLPFVYQGRRLVLDITPGGLALRFRGPGEPIVVENAGKRRRLTADGVFRGKLLPPAHWKRSVQEA